MEYYEHCYRVGGSGGWWRNDKCFFDKEVELLETEAVFSVENDEKSDVNMENTEKEKLLLFWELRKLWKSWPSFATNLVFRSSQYSPWLLQKVLFKAKTSKKKKINIYDFYELSKKPKNPSDTSPK